jgi:hypothetical protein
MTVLLVRVECLCGAVAAIPEGGHFPLCGLCGRRMVTVPLGDGGQGPRAERGMGYTAELMREAEAVKRSTDKELRVRDRVYSDEDLRASLEKRGWPVEDQSPAWPQRPRLDMDDGSTYGVPPWETQ